MDRQARLRRSAALALIALAACAAAPASLRLEDRPQENVVRIANPTSHAVRLYVSRVAGFSEDFQIFRVRYRDAEGRPVALSGEAATGWWTPLVYSSSAYPVGRTPSRRLSVAARGLRDLSRTRLFAWLNMFPSAFVPVAGPCTAQLRLVGRAQPRAVAEVWIDGDWQPAPCPTPVTPPTGH